MNGNAERHATRLIAIALGVTTLAALGLAVVYLLGGQTQLEGILLAIALGGLGYAFVVIGAPAAPPGSVHRGPQAAGVEPRGHRRLRAATSRRSTTSTEGEDATKDGIARRKLLARMLGAAAGALGLAALVPHRLARPRPGNSLFVTKWRQGSRVVNEQGEPVNVDDLEVGGVITVFPRRQRRRRRQPDAPDPARRRPTSPPGPAARPGRPRATSRTRRSARTRVSRRPLPAVDRASALPVPPVDVRRRERRDARCSVPRRAPSRSCRSWSTTTASCGRRATTTSPSGPASGTANADGRRTHRPLVWTNGSASARFARTALNKVFPDHWSFMIGEIAMYCLVILILTGVYLTFFFVPDSRQVVYDGSYAPLRGVRMSAGVRVDAERVVRRARRPRDAPDPPLGRAALRRRRSSSTSCASSSPARSASRASSTGWSALTLLLLALANGFTGYSLPDDLLSGTGLRIAYSVLLSIPLVGPWLAFLVFGGEFPSDDIIPRLFVIHVLIVPALIVGLLTAHLAMLVRQKHTQFAGRGPTEDNVVGSKLWPTFTAKTLGLFFFVFAVLRGARRPGADQPDLALRAVRPVGGERGLAARLVHRLARRRAAAHAAVGGPDRRVRDPEPVLPRRAPARASRSRVLYVWPWIEERVTKDHGEHHILDRPRDRPRRTAIGVAVLAFYVVLFLAGGNDVIAARFDLSVNAVTYVVPGAACSCSPSCRPSSRTGSARSSPARDRVDEETARGARTDAGRRLRRSGRAGDVSP